MRFKFKRTPSLKQFLLLSLYLHIVVGVIHALLPDDEFVRQQLPPIKVSYLPPEKKQPPQKTARFVDAPKPEKVETPRTSDVISRYDSRAHSNKKSKKHQVYKNNKTATPRAKKSLARTRIRPTPQKSSKPKLVPKKNQKPFRRSDQGFALPKNHGEVTREPSPKRIEGGSMALLEGFDPDKYAKLDTQSPVPQDDGDVISLDTKESKYAAYFARIKHQIEQVWNYPDEAKRRGIGGELSLRFQIAKDGKLMNVWLMDKSGSHLLDDAALSAIKNAAPYYPFPVTIERESISILVTFVYESRAANSDFFPKR